MKRLLPPQLFYVCTLLMVLLRLIWPLEVFIPFPLNLLGALLLLGGLALLILAAGHFARLGTEIKTFDEPRIFVTTGLFRYSRNPMYLGFLIALLGIWLFLGAASPILGVLLFAIITDRWYITLEERTLKEKFGKEYEAYQSRTRRWL